METVWTQFQQCSAISGLFACYNSTFGIAGHMVLAGLIILATAPLRYLLGTSLFDCDGGSDGWFDSCDGGDGD